MSSETPDVVDDKTQPETPAEMDDVSQPESPAEMDDVTQPEPGRSVKDETEISFYRRRRKVNWKPGSSLVETRTFTITAEEKEENAQWRIEYSMQYINSITEQREEKKEKAKKEDSQRKMS